MTDEERNGLYRDIDGFLHAQREHANVEPVSAEEQRQAKQLFARGRFSGGICVQCGEARLHGHGIVS